MIARFHDPDAIALRRKAGERLATLLKSENPTLFLTSGGSALALLDHVDATVLGPNHTLGVLDDRWTKDEKKNNFLQFAASEFGQGARALGAVFISTVPEQEESIRETALRFEKGLRAWKSKHSTGRVVITQGIGTDGHTAGILPFPENPEEFEKLFNDPARWVADHDASGKSEYPLRITATLPFLREMVDHSLVYLGSPDKELTLQKVLAGGPLAEIPARITREMRNVDIYSVFDASAY